MSLLREPQLEFSRQISEVETGDRGQSNQRLSRCGLEIVGVNRSSLTTKQLDRRRRYGDQLLACPPKGSPLLQKHCQVQSAWKGTSQVLQQRDSTPRNAPAIAIGH